MKLRILTLLILFAQSSFAQSKNNYLKNNRFDLLSSSFQFPQKDFKIIGFGAYHGSQKTEQVEYILLENLVKQGKIKYYLPETDFGLAYYFNQYLKSGDTLLLKDLVKHYGNRVPQEKSIAIYNKWKNIRQLNDHMLEKNRLTVVGIDLMVTYKYTTKLLIELLPLTSGKLKSYDSLVEMVKIDTTDYSPDKESYAKKLLKTFISEYENRKAEFKSNNQPILDHLISNIKITFTKAGREKTIFENYVALSQTYNFNTSPQFVRMGFFHIEKDRENNNPSFFTRLIENKIYDREQVIAVAGFLTKSRVLWDVKYNDKNEYLSFTTEGGFGIGDYWKEYFKGIHLLKKNRLSDLTLYRLNQKGSPYQQNQKDLMQIKMFLKKSNKNDLKDKTTTDYFDYAILISNSEANKPIEELGTH